MPKKKKQPRKPNNSFRNRQPKEEYMVSPEFLKAVQDGNVEEFFANVIAVAELAYDDLDDDEEDGTISK